MKSETEDGMDVAIAFVEARQKYFECYRDGAMMRTAPAVFAVLDELTTFLLAEQSRRRARVPRADSVLQGIASGDVIAWCTHASLWCLGRVVEVAVQSADRWQVRIGDCASDNWREEQARGDRRLYPDPSRRVVLLERVRKP